MPPKSDVLFMYVMDFRLRGNDGKGRRGRAGVVGPSCIANVNTPRDPGPVAGSLFAEPLDRFQGQVVAVDAKAVDRAFAGG